MKPRTRFRGLTLFVTVGSTRFDKLINRVLSVDFAEQLLELGFIKMIIQAGRSEYSIEQVDKITNEHKFDIEIYDYKPSILEDIERADIVIGHAGAGTCLEVLRSNTRLLICVNDNLMDNHQNELADELAKHSYVLKTTIEDLEESLNVICDTETKLAPFPPKDDSKFEEIFGEALRKVSSRL